MGTRIVPESHAARKLHCASEVASMRHLHTPADAVRNYPANSIDNVLASSLRPAWKPCKLGSSRAELRDLPRVPRAA